MKLSPNAKAIYGIIAVLFILMFLLYKVSLNLWGMYTIGSIYKINTSRGGTTISYKFYVNGKRYGGMITEPMGSENVGKHYFIKFLRRAPAINLLLPEHPAENCQNFNNQVFAKLPDCE